ncbi:CotH kinase family protein [Anaerovorax odorimutans]|uniref:CotH kinase family protein n=1 Tax=Anaerovorax odorimutans TaxID=109327 RepID=A0ABT1RQ24_9FIRM|nr:CotH kinase family protein [Anaerovorax odorimutans]MCQ4637261.1 CotH kinase family protein [Anaerovorax odorimutans]
MKRRLLCAAAILAVFVIAAAANWYIDVTNENTDERVHQHEQAQTVKACDHDDSVFCTHLPLVSIDTEGKNIPIDKEEIFCRIKIYDKEGVNHHLSDKSDIDTKSTINIRGASSRHFDKHSYRMEFRSGRDQQKKRNLKVMGMAADCDWILNGPFLDKSLMRNYMMYNLSGEIMAWAPNVRFCEVFLNGEYQGVYVMTETIKVDQDRVDLHEYDPKEIETSYLIERNRPNTTSDAVMTFGKQAGYTEGELGILYPNRKNITEQTYDWIRDDINEIEKLLYSLDYDEWNYGYYNFIDVDSFVDYVVINEFSNNLDQGSYSTYAYRPLGGKLTMGPVWDFNNSFGLYDKNPMGFFLYGKPWFMMLMKDETFVQDVIDRYRVLRKSYLSEDYLFSYIDSVREYLGPAVDRNFEKWGYSFEKRFFDDPKREIRSYDQAIGQLKSFIHQRIEFMDENIEVLKQYCHESMVKPYN